MTGYSAYPCPTCMTKTLAYSHPCRARVLCDTCGWASPLSDVVKELDRRHINPYKE